MSNDIEKLEGSLAGEAGGRFIRTSEEAAPDPARAGQSAGPGAGRRSGRRGFLAGAGAAGAGVAAAFAARSSQPLGPDESDSARKDAPPEAGRGYHETAHVRKYYETTKV